MSSNKRHRHASPQVGRVWVVFVFLMLRAVDLVIYCGVPVITRHHLMGVILNGVIWSTVLLIGIWFRKAWARIILVFLLLASVGLAMIFWTGLADVHVSAHFVGLSIGVNLAVALILICSPSVRKLTSRI